MEQNSQRRCEYCWNPFGEHNDGCPILFGTAAAMAKWERGRNQGFEDDTEGLKPWQMRHYDATFIFGYRVGQAEIDELVDAAAQERI